uniref:Uncharacterized protein n=1 Tax=Peromyscus maniculatus bairdii TaxID=230844 RepID=A0A8C8US04_PERMB
RVLGDWAVLHVFLLCGDTGERPRYCPQYILGNFIDHRCFKIELLSPAGLLRFLLWER